MEINHLIAMVSAVDAMANFLGSFECPTPLVLDMHPSEL